MRSLRMPSLEELYSEGPHLAAYAYEVGDPDLDAERGWGVEVFARYDALRAAASLHVFNNDLNDYIYPRNTGMLNTRILLPVYQTTGATVRLYGGEFSGTWHVSGSLSLEGTASYVHATLTDVDEPLPWIPPLGGTLGLRYRAGALSVGTTVRGATKQDRLGVFEEGTDGYGVLDLFGQYYFSTGRFLHTLDVGVENVTDTEYRDHLSRVKSIMPEPGINVKLLYKVYF